MHSHELRYLTFSISPGGRSAEYHAWLKLQTPERRRELHAAENAYNRAVRSPTGATLAAATAYAESMQALDPAPAM
jgi:hypothetical protein